MRCGGWLGQLRMDRNFGVRRHQKSLAGRLGLKEQQLLRYEASGVCFGEFGAGAQHGGGFGGGLAGSGVWAIAVGGASELGDACVTGCVGIMAWLCGAGWRGVEFMVLGVEHRNKLKPARIRWA